MKGRAAAVRIPQCDRFAPAIHRRSTWFVVIRRSDRSRRFVDSDAHRGVLCKHVRRVAFATGARAIPAWVTPADVDAHLGMHVAGTPRVVATDGGQLAPEVAEQVTDEEIAASEEREQVTDRPDDCACWDVAAGLPCWPCFRDGFDTQNPAEPTAESDDSHAAILRVSVS